MHFLAMATRSVTNEHAEEYEHFDVTAKIPYDLYERLSPIERIYDLYGYISTGKPDAKLRELEEIESTFYGIYEVTESEKFQTGEKDFRFVDLSFTVYPEAMEKFKAIARPHHTRFIVKVNIYTDVKEVDGKEVLYLDYFTLSSPDEE